VEIWNIVFNEYFCSGSRAALDAGEATLTKLPFLGIDTGMGLERLAAIVQKKKSVYENDALSRSARIVFDHTRAAKALLDEGVVPSNVGQGYVLRRFIRRAVMHADKIGVKVDTAFAEEETSFRITLAAGLKEFEKMATKGISAKEAFLLFSSYGLPIDITLDLAKGKNVAVDVAGFEKELERHKEVSRVGMEKKFKGGLADTSEVSVKYHTATHLLHQALRDVLGSKVRQKGSNITPERLRFDFAFPRKLTNEEKTRVEAIVNEKILADLPVHKVTLPLAEARASGALHFFDEKYPDEVLVHYIGDSLENAYSKEFCGGPHVARTGILGRFSIAKEEAVSAGVRRIKAVLN
jgi:alanyl-tRNA synthetase